MTDQIIAELESAANIIMAPPNVVTNEQRHAAESIFLDFRKTKSPYNICREILEKSGNQYVMFEAAEVIKNAIIREWGFLLDSDKLSLRQYLFEYVLTHETPPCVRERILQVIAIMVKRYSIDDNGRERGNLLREVESLIVNSEPQKKILGCNIITHVMQEYATTVKSTDVGLPWEVHFKAKKQFEATDLKRIFQFTIYLLTEVGKTDVPFADNMVVLVGHLLKILEAVLTWGYVSPLHILSCRILAGLYIMPKRLIGVYEAVYEADVAPALKLPASWAEYIFNPDLLPLIFQIYWKVRENDRLSHPALSCLVQLASLSGRVIVTIKSKEAIGIANIVKKLIIFFIHDILKLSDDLKDTLLDEFTRFTCHFCEGAALEEAQEEEDRNFCEAFDSMLEVWTTILQEFGPATVDNKLFDCSKRVFEKYIQCRLAPPDGCRRPQLNVEKDDETDESDKELYKDQLQAIGLLLESRTSTLFNSFQEIRNRSLSVSEAVGLETLYEDIHWILLIAGQVLCLPILKSVIISLAVLCRTICYHFRNEAVLSPELGSSIMWFLNRFCVNYLMPVESYYTEMSPTFLGCLGVDTEGAQLVIRYVLKKIQSNVYYFQSEAQLLQETIDCFCHIVSSKHKGFSLCGACLSAEPESMRSYFVGIMGSLQRRFETICTVEGGLASKTEDQRTLIVIVDLLEAFIVPSTSSQRNACLYVLFQQLPRHCSVDPRIVWSSIKILYESALATVQTYAKCNMNRFSTESFAEDSSFQDLALVLELLTFIISKDCFDLYVTSNDEEITVTASDVSLFGLSFILPLMSMDLLKYPSLCMQYYSIEFGLTNFGSDIVQICLDFLQGMASYIFRRKLINTPIYVGLRPFLKILIDLTLSHQINSDLMGAASTSIYALMCCYQEMQTDPMTRERLAAAFNNLVMNVDMNCERLPKLKFRDNFEKFIANVHGFLLIK
nr:unnamed protein product [Callosobruchus analis]